LLRARSIGVIGEVETKEDAQDSSPKTNRAKAARRTQNLAPEPEEKKVRQTVCTGCAFCGAIQSYSKPLI
jgi:coenzyme F420-reducing hydrogenase gamma subunit